MRDAYTYANGAWSTGTQIDYGVTNVLESVSCASPTFCMAVDAGGYSISYVGDTLAPGIQPQL